jgi:hypothetical protein
MSEGSDANCPNFQIGDDSRLKLDLFVCCVAISIVRAEPHNRCEDLGTKTLTDVVMSQDTFFMSVGNGSTGKGVTSRRTQQEFSASHLRATRPTTCKEVLVNEDWMEWKGAWLPK